MRYLAHSICIFCTTPSQAIAGAEQTRTGRAQTLRSKINVRVPDHSTMDGLLLAIQATPMTCPNVIVMA
jgi:hypothetical protein